MKRRSEEQIRNNQGCGQVLGVEIGIKVVGCDYNESTSTQIIHYYTTQ